MQEKINTTNMFDRLANCLNLRSKNSDYNVTVKSVDGGVALYTKLDGETLLSTFHIENTERAGDYMKRVVDAYNTWIYRARGW